MSAKSLIALCHFCELHGPKWLFCTQHLPAEGTRDASDEKRCELLVVPRSNSPHSCMTIESVDTSYGVASANVEDRRCNACCRPTYDIISRSDADIFVSSPHLQSRVNSIVRATCIRSLSSEVVGPGREGAMLYGDEDSGFSVAYVFKINDSQARGFQRWMSIAFVERNLNRLVASWSFLTFYIKRIASYLQKHAARTFAVEMASLPHMEPSLLGRRPATAQLRSLPDLLHVRNVFTKLHSTFCWILHCYTTRLLLVTHDSHVPLPKEVPLVSSQQFANLSSSDLDASETFVSEVTQARRSQAPSPARFQSPMTHSSVVAVPADGSDGPMPDLDLDSRFSPITGFAVMPDGAESTAHQKEADLFSSYDDIPGAVSPPLTVLRSRTPPSADANLTAFTSIVQLANAIGAAAFRVVVYNVVIGNQLIVRGNDIDAVVSTLSVAQSLLPNECCDLVKYDGEYQDAYLHKFLGLPANVDVPEYVDGASYALLDIHARFCGSMGMPVRGSSAMVGYQFHVRGPYRPTTLGNSVLQLFFNPKMQHTSEVKDAFLDCIKTEWTHKAKAVYEYRRMLLRKQIDEEQAAQRLQSFSLSLDLCHDDMMVFRFWSSVFRKK